MKNIVFLTYGNPIEYKRAIFAIYSFLAWRGGTRDNVRILCYTDNAEFFETYLGGLNILYIPLTTEFMRKMLGASNNICRRKICILQDVFINYPTDDILYLDSDTFFINDVGMLLNQIQPGHSIMHMREYPLENAVKIYRKSMSNGLPNAEAFPKSFIKLIEGNVFNIGGRPLSFTQLNYVWNAGVLGINNSHLPLLADIFSFNDRIYAETKWSISEQLSFSLILQSFSKLRPVNQFINHYYQSENIVDFFINKCMNQNFLDLNASEKLSIIKASTINIDKLVNLDLYVSISTGAFKGRKIQKGFKFAIRAIQSIPLSSWTLDYFKLKYNRRRSMGKKLFL
jgi:hypothetical protein